MVNDFTPSGDVLVEYPNRRWRYNPEALTKVCPSKVKLIINSLCSKVYESDGET